MTKDSRESGIFCFFAKVFAVSVAEFRKKLYFCKKLESVWQKTLNGQTITGYF
jgi:hypothetical protein